MYSDGTYQCSSSNPNHPQGVFLSGDGFDPLLAEDVESGRKIDLRWIDLPDSVQGAVFASLNQSFSDWFERFSPPSNREDATEYGGSDLVNRAGEGIYGVDGNYRIRIEAYPDDGSGSDDLGPYTTIREALLDTLPGHYDIAGPEYHSTVNIWDKDEDGLSMKFFNILIPYCCTVLVRVPAEKIDSEEEAFELAIDQLDKLEPTLQFTNEDGLIDEGVLSILDGRYVKSVIYNDSCQPVSRKIGWSDTDSPTALRGAPTQKGESDICRETADSYIGSDIDTIARDYAIRLLAAEQRLATMQCAWNDHAKELVNLSETWQRCLETAKSAHALEVDALHARLSEIEASRLYADSVTAIQFEAGQAKGGELRVCSVIYSDSGRILEVMDAEYRKCSSQYKNVRFLGSYKITVAEYRRLIKEFGERK